MKCTSFLVTHTKQKPLLQEQHAANLQQVSFECHQMVYHETTAHTIIKYKIYAFFLFLFLFFPGGGGVALSCKIWPMQKLSGLVSQMVNHTHTQKRHLHIGGNTYHCAKKNNGDGTGDHDCVCSQLSVPSPCKLHIHDKGSMTLLPNLYPLIHSVFMTYLIISKCHRHSTSHETSPPYNYL